jgi:hypothetical protein
MADDVDMAVEIADEHLARGIARARQPIPAGVPGECEQCFEDSPRLVNGRCAFCRDGRRRPANPTSKQPAPVPAPSTEDIMPAKSVQLPASADVAIACLEEHARGNNLPLGQAAAELIERGAATVTAPPGASPATLSLDDLIRLIRDRFDERPDQAAELAAATERADAAEARATAAEERAKAADAKLAQARALFA